MKRLTQVRTMGQWSAARLLALATFVAINVTPETRGDVITFAQFTQQVVSDPNFVYSNNGTNAAFGSVAGGIPIFLLVTDGFAPNLPRVESAHLILTSSSTANVVAPVPPDQFMQQHFTGPANILQILLDTPVDGKTDFLTVTFSDGLLSGRLHSTEASLKSSATGGGKPSQVQFSSDFIDFSAASEGGFSLSFSSINSLDGSGDLQTAANGFFKSFSSSGTGTFDAEFVVPAPSGFRLAAFGLLGVLGLAWQCRGSRRGGGRRNRSGAFFGFCRSCRLVYSCRASGRIQQCNSFNLCTKRTVISDMAAKEARRREARLLKITRIQDCAGVEHAGAFHEKRLSQLWTGRVLIGRGSAGTGTRMRRLAAHARPGAACSSAALLRRDVSRRWPADPAG